MRCEYLVEHTADLAGADHAHVQPVEHLGCFSSASESAMPASTSLRTWPMILRELRVLGLLLEHRKGAQHRQPGVDHGRELPREDGQVFAA